MSNDFSGLNSVKANFDAIYSQPDPREYFRVLGGLDYVIPDLAKIPLRALTHALRRRHGRKLKIADIGCSYGINAALLRYPLDLARLSHRYAAEEIQRMDSKALAGLDRHYYRSWPPLNRDTFIGVDTSLPATAYALRTGLLDAAVTSNLEEQPPTPTESEALRGLHLVMSTGCVGYVTEATIARILQAQGGGETPWVANLVLRMFPYERIAETLAGFGLVTEKLEGITFVQRRFHSAQEYDQTIGSLKAQGIEANGKESEGLFHAELYVSRPARDVEQQPLREMISITSGAHRHYGRRFTKAPDGKVKLMN